MSIQLDANVTDVDFETPAARLEGKSPFYSDAIIGADGVKSLCREVLLGRPDPPRLTGDLAYRITVKTEDMKHKPELADIVRHPSVRFWMGPNAHVVCYFLQGGALCNIVLVCPDNLPELVNIAKADLQEMRHLFEGWDPRLKSMLELVQETSKWRLMNSVEMGTWSHPSGKFVLLGDARHATLPYL